MASDALKKAQAKYDAAHTKQIRLKLNKETDADILRRLDQVDNKQGYIKELIRADMRIDDRWIPITEQAPPEGNHILVTLKWKEDDYEVCELDYGMDKHEGGRLASKVIAWMYMPKPYYGDIRKEQE